MAEMQGNLIMARMWKHLQETFCSFWSDKETTRIVLLLVATQIVAILCGVTIFPHGFQYVHNNILHKLMVWDGARYLLIGEHGYTWNQAFCEKHYCEIAFFPLQGMLDRAIFSIFFSTLGINAVFAFIILLSWIFGLLSIFYFARLARTIMEQGAKNAIFLFAFYPGSVFFLMGYPTGLISILGIMAVLSALQGHWWRTALWIGIGTATAPTIVFVGFPIGVFYLIQNFKKNQPISFLLSIPVWAILALSGLLLFVVYQYFTFGTTLAFIEAQEAWGTTPGFLEKINRLITPGWYLGYYREVIAWINIAYHKPVTGYGVGAFALQGQVLHLSDFFELECQSIVNLLFLFLGWAGVILCWFFCFGKKNKYLLCAIGFCVIAGYMWFVGAAGMSMQSTIRLIFPALAIFIGLGGITAKFKILEFWLFPLFVGLTFMHTAYVVSGYVVI